MELESEFLLEKYEASLKEVFPTGENWYDFDNSNAAKIGLWAGGVAPSMDESAKDIDGLTASFKRNGSQIRMAKGNKIIYYTEVGKHNLLLPPKYMISEVFKADSDAFSDIFTRIGIGLSAVGEMIRTIKKYTDAGEKVNWREVLQIGVGDLIANVTGTVLITKMATLLVHFIGLASGYYGYKSFCNSNTSSCFRSCIR